MGVPRFLWFWRTDEETDLHALNNLSSSIDKVSFTSNSITVGLVLLEEKLFTQTLQSDAMISQLLQVTTDLLNCENLKVII